MNHYQKQNMSSTQRRMLSKSEIEFLQKDKKVSLQKMTELFKQLNLGEKISAKHLVT